MHGQPVNRTPLPGLAHQWLNLRARAPRQQPRAPRSLTLSPTGQLPPRSRNWLCRVPRADALAQCPSPPVIPLLDATTMAAQFATTIVRRRITPHL